MKFAAALACAYIHFIALGTAAILAGYFQKFGVPTTGCIFLGALIAAIIPIHREVCLYVLLGAAFGWLVALAPMVALVPLLLFIERRGKAMLKRMEVGVTTTPT